LYQNKLFNHQALTLSPVVVYAEPIPDRSVYC